ncbi:hypothetical protein K449DRAFT_437374 [Hypoxylon sp. EC38]|nr:hypothetical protein K449DRAFT_437374 [Hypoxylon sp. EC38]
MKVPHISTTWLHKGYYNGEEASRSDILYLTIQVKPVSLGEQANITVSQVDPCLSGQYSATYTHRTDILFDSSVLVSVALRRPSVLEIELRNANGEVRLRSVELPTEMMYTHDSNFYGSSNSDQIPHKARSEEKKDLCIPPRQKVKFIYTRFLIFGPFTTSIYKPDVFLLFAFPIRSQTTTCESSNFLISVVPTRFHVPQMRHFDYLQLVCSFSSPKRVEGCIDIANQDSHNLTDRDRVQWSKNERGGLREAFDTYI